MSKLIGIIAPSMNESIDDRGLEFVFRLKHKKTDRELSFKYLYELAVNSYDLNKLNKLDNANYHDETISAAGYYLTGLLRKNNYDTVLTNKIDTYSLKSIADKNPIAVCVSTTMIFSKKALINIINNIRKVMPDVFIITGGPLIWKSYQWIDFTSKNPNVQNNKYFDTKKIENMYVFPCLKQEVNADLHIVSPHGATILLRVLDKIIEGKSDFSEIPNLALYNSSGISYFSNRINEDVDYNTDYTRWDLLDKLPEKISITTSYGCPYRCGFCDFCTLHPRIKMRSKESLLSELKLIKSLLSNNQRTRLINVTDDNVFITSKRTIDICETIIESKIGLIWSGFTRAGSINRDNIELIKRSGLVVPYIGVESGDQNQLNRMNKKTTVEELKRGIELLNEIGSFVNMFFVVGYPGENDETIQNTANFMNNLSIQNAQFEVFPLYIAPLSSVSMLENRKKFNLTGIGDNWSHYTMDSESVRDYCYKLCRKINKIQYMYLEENAFFNMKYLGIKLKRLINLRHDMTLKIINKRPWKSIAENINSINNIFGLTNCYPKKEFIDEIACSK